MVIAGWLGDYWKSPTTRIKQSILSYIQSKYFPFLSELGEGDQLNLLNGYADLVNLKINMPLGGGHVCIGRAQIWVSWDRLIALMTEEGAQIINTPYEEEDFYEGEQLPAEEEEEEQLPQDEEMTFPFALKMIIWDVTGTVSLEHLKKTLSTLAEESLASGDASGYTGWLQRLTKDICVTVHRVKDLELTDYLKASANELEYAAEEIQILDMRLVDVDDVDVLLSPDKLTLSNGNLKVDGSVELQVSDKLLELIGNLGDFIPSNTTPSLGLLKSLEAQKVTIRYQHATARCTLLRLAKDLITIDSLCVTHPQWELQTQTLIEVRLEDHFPTNIKLGQICVTQKDSSEASSPAMTELMPGTLLTQAGLFLDVQQIECTTLNLLLRDGTSLAAHGVSLIKGSFLVDRIKYLDLVIKHTSGTIHRQGTLSPTMDAKDCHVEEAFPFDPCKILIEDHSFIRYKHHGNVFKRLFASSNISLTVNISRVEGKLDNLPSNCCLGQSLIPNIGGLVTLHLRIETIQTQFLDANKASLWLHANLNQHTYIVDGSISLNCLDIKEKFLVERFLVSAHKNAKFAFMKKHGDGSPVVTLSADGLLFKPALGHGDSTAQPSPPDMVSNLLKPWTEKLNFNVEGKRLAVKTSMSTFEWVFYTDIVRISPRISTICQGTLYFGREFASTYLQTPYSNADTCLLDAGLLKLATIDNSFMETRSLLVDSAHINLHINEQTLRLLWACLSPYDTFHPGQQPGSGSPDFCTSPTTAMSSIEELTRTQVFEGTDADKEQEGSGHLEDEGAVNQPFSMPDIDRGFMLTPTANALDQAGGEDDDRERTSVSFVNCSITAWIEEWCKVKAMGITGKVNTHRAHLRVRDVVGYDLARHPIAAKWPIFFFKQDSMDVLSNFVEVLCEWPRRLCISVLPLKVRIDQRLLLKTINLIVNATMSRGEGGGRGTEQRSSQQQSTFNRVSISALALSLDYQPTRHNTQETTEGIRLANRYLYTLQMLALLKFRDANLRLPAIRARNSSVVGCIRDQWIPWMAATSGQTAATLVTSITPVRTVVRLGTGMASLLVIPISEFVTQEYRKSSYADGNNNNEDGNLDSGRLSHQATATRAIRLGVQAFASTAGVELAAMGASIFEQSLAMLRHFYPEPATGGASRDDPGCCIVAVPVSINPANGQRTRGLLPVALLGQALQAGGHVMRTLQARVQRQARVSHHGSSGDTEGEEVCQSFAIIELTSSEGEGEGEDDDNDVTEKELE